jgi:hypothetical protein
MEDDSKELTFWEELEEKAETPIEAVCIGEYGWGGYVSGKDCEKRRNMVPKDKQNILLTAEEAAKYLSYDFDSGYGAPKCHSVTVWSETRVVFVVQYDGSVSIDYVPRAPEPNSAVMFGQ